MTREDSSDPIREEPAFGEPDRLQARLPDDRRARNPEPRSLTGACANKPRVTKS